MNSAELPAVRVLLMLLVAVALAVGIAPAPGAAQSVDVAQETSDTELYLFGGPSAWQTFTPTVTGLLGSVELRLERHCPPVPCSGPPGTLTVAIVTTSGGVPTGTVLASATLPGTAAPDSAAFLSVDLSSANLILTAGTLYAIRVSGSSPPEPPGWVWSFAEASNPYAGGGFFIDDLTPGVPSQDLYPNADGTFRTLMTPVVCGDGIQNGGEECDDGNLVDGDGCSAECITELCGDGIKNDVVETCDDGNTASGDGCSATCTLEKSGLACQTAILKAGQKYASARLAALTKCQVAFAAGKPLSVEDPDDCASETAAAKSIARAAAALRNAIAGGAKPKCTDAIVATLGACSDTVDGLVSPDASGGCLRAADDAAVADILESRVGD
jgi:cysteine-rich repeat protein